MLAAHDNPDLADGVVMSAPLLGIQKPMAKNNEAFWAAMPLPRWVNEHYIPLTDPIVWRRSEKRDDPNVDEFSSDPERSLIHDYWREKNPDLRVIAPKWGWVKASCKAIA